MAIFYWLSLKLETLEGRVNIKFAEREKIRQHSSGTPSVHQHMYCCKMQLDIKREPGRAGLCRHLVQYHLKAIKLHFPQFLFKGQKPQKRGFYLGLTTTNFF